MRKATNEAHLPCQACEIAEHENVGSLQAHGRFEWKKAYGTDTIWIVSGEEKGEMKHSWWREVGLESWVLHVYSYLSQRFKEVWCHWLWRFQVFAEVD